MNFKIIFLLVSLFSFAANGQISVDEAVNEAAQKLASGQVEEAVAELEVIISNNPEHQHGLSTLANAYRRQEDYQKSLELFVKLQQLQPASEPAIFNLGVAHALAGDLNSAFKWLIQLRDSKTFNLTNVGLSPAASALREDNRYVKLFPTKDAYADPFVEKGVDVLYDWRGENAGDQFGWIARNIGDVDRDGVNDLVTSAPTNGEGAPAGGKIYVYSGKTGKQLWSYAAKDENGWLGMSVEAAQDVNGDNIPDVVAGAPYTNKVYVFSGISGEILFEWQGEKVNGAFGRGVRGIGDVNRDGFGDVLVGEPYQVWAAPINADSIAHAGVVYVYSGKDGSVLHAWEGEQTVEGFGTALSGSTIEENTYVMIGAPGGGDLNAGLVNVYKGLSDKPYFTMQADSTGVALGAMFMSVVGDVNNDGIPDFYASDWVNGAGGPGTGRAYVYSGKNGSQLVALTGEVARDGFGIGNGDAGDVNNDGYDDLIIASWQHRSAAVSGGKIYIYSGKDFSLLRTLTGKIPGETLGFDTTGIGDVNGDGFVDYLITSAWSGINDTRSGRVYIISGKPN